MYVNTDFGWRPLHGEDPVAEQTGTGAAGGGGGGGSRRWGVAGAAVLLGPAVRE